MVSIEHHKFSHATISYTIQEIYARKLGLYLVPYANSFTNALFGNAYAQIMSRKSKIIPPNALITI